MSSENLIFGLLAFQNDFIDRQQLLDAFAIWVSDRSQSMADMLVQRGALSYEDRKLLERLVERHVEKHGDVTRLFSQISSVGSLKDDLNEVVAKRGIAVDEIPWFSGTMAFEGKQPVAAAQRNGPTQGPVKAWGGMDRFRIVKEHARGGLGVVFVAEDQQLRREVALKQIRKDKADEEPYRQKFKQEAEVTGQLEHPGIVPIYALGVDDAGRPYYAMRFIKGESLKESIQQFHKENEEQEHKTSRFDSPQLRQLLRRFIDVCNAIDYAHERGVLHRDLKPGNVMLGKYGETLIVDWGLAKPLGSKTGQGGSESSEMPVTSNDSGSGSETRYGTFLGTAAYAPPEQLRGELDQLTASSDVYSLGAVLFELLTGSPPIKDAKGIENVLKQIEELQTRSVRDINSRIPQPLAFVCSKAMSLHASNRYASVRDLKEDVQRFLDDQSIQGMKESFASKAGRWLRNHQTLATSGAVGLLVSAILFSVLAVIMQNAYLDQVKANETEKSLRTKAEDANLELLLNSATLARNRGQFREAAQKMSEIKKQKELNGEQSLAMLRDLYFAQNAKDAFAELEKIDREKLSPIQLAELEMLQGDMLLMTRDDAKGFKLIEKAIQSDALSPADQAYCQALVAETAEVCFLRLDECLKLDPFNANALSRRGACHLIVGRTNKARLDAELGSTLFLEDMRFPFLSALVSASQGDVEAATTAITRFAGGKGYEQEIRVLQIVSKLHQKLGNVATAFDPQGSSSQMSSIEIGKIVIELMSLIASKYSDANQFGIPKTAWMGKLYKQLPSSVLEQAALAAGMLPVKNRIMEVQKQAPEHQFGNFSVGYTLFSEGQNREAYKSFLAAAKSDVLFNDLNQRSIWWALLSFVADSVLTKKPYDESNLVELIQLMQERRQKDGKFVTAPVDSQLGWTILIRARMYGLAMELAQQELETAEESAKPKWQSFADEAIAMREKSDSMTQEVLDKYNPK